MAQTTYTVCPTCEGHGKMVHRALSVWTESDRAEDPESFETMMAGGYDITCDQCHGLRVVTEEQQGEFEEKRQNWLYSLQEQGIYPGHQDYF